MILHQSLYSTLFYATLGATVALNTTAFGLWPGSGVLHLDPLPNPYPVPNTRITLNFDPHHQSLFAPDVIGCLQKAQDEFFKHIREEGDDVFISPLDVNYKTAGIRITPTVAPLPHFWYNDTFAVLEGIGQKMSHEGYWRWYAEVHETQGYAFLGAVVVYRHGPP